MTVTASLSCYNSAFFHTCVYVTKQYILVLVEMVGNNAVWLCWPQAIIFPAVFVGLFYFAISQLSPNFATC